MVIVLHQVVNLLSLWWRWTRIKSTSNHAALMSQCIKLFVLTITLTPQCCSRSCKTAPRHFKLFQTLEWFQGSLLEYVFLNFHQKLHDSITSPASSFSTTVPLISKQFNCKDFAMLQLLHSHKTNFSSPQPTVELASVKACR